MHWQAALRRRSGRSPQDGLGPGRGAGDDAEAGARATRQARRAAPRPGPPSAPPAEPGQPSGPHCCCSRAQSAHSTWIPCISCPARHVPSPLGAPEERTAGRGSRPRGGIRLPARAGTSRAGAREPSRAASLGESSAPPSAAYSASDESIGRTSGVGLKSGHEPWSSVRSSPAGHGMPRLRAIRDRDEPLTGPGAASDRAGPHHLEAPVHPAERRRSLPARIAIAPAKDSSPCKWGLPPGLSRGAFGSRPPGTRTVRCGQLWARPLVDARRCPRIHRRRPRGPRRSGERGRAGICPCLRALERLL